MGFVRLPGIAREQRGTGQLVQVPGEQRDEVCWRQAHSGAAALPGLRDRNTGHETQTQLWCPRWVQWTEERTGERTTAVQGLFHGVRRGGCSEMVRDPGWGGADSSGLERHDLGGRWKRQRRWVCPRGDHEPTPAGPCASVSSSVHEESPGAHPSCELVAFALPCLLPFRTSSPRSHVILVANN